MKNRRNNALRFRILFYLALTAIVRFVGEEDVPEKILTFLHQLLRPFHGGQFSGRGFAIRCLFDEVLFGVFFDDDEETFLRIRHWVELNQFHISLPG